MNGTIIIKTILMLSLSMIAISCNSKGPTLEEKTNTGDGHSGNVIGDNGEKARLRAENAELRNRTTTLTQTVGDLQEQIRDVSVADFNCTPREAYNNYGGDLPGCLDLITEGLDTNAKAIKILELCHKGGHDFKMAEVNMGEAALYTIGSSIVAKYTNGGGSSDFASDLSNTIKDMTKSKISAVDHYNQLTISKTVADQNCLTKNQATALDGVIDNGKIVLKTCNAIFNKRPCDKGESPLGDTDKNEEDAGDEETEQDQNQDNDTLLEN